MVKIYTGKQIVADLAVLEAELVALRHVEDAARAAKGVLQDVQLVWLPDSHNVRVVLAALTDTLDALKKARGDDNKLAIHDQTTSQGGTDAKK